jgi:hypothetical protein
MFRSAKPVHIATNNHIDFIWKITIVHSEMQNRMLDKCIVRNNDANWTRLMPADLKGEESMVAIEQARLAVIAPAAREQE